jgi:hypothetical protein
LWEKYELVNSDEYPVEPPDKTAYLKELSSWGPQGSEDKAGAVDYGINGSFNEWDKFELTNSFGKVLEVGWCFFWTQPGPYSPGAPSVITNSDYAQPISSTWPVMDGIPGFWNFIYGNVAFLLNREVSNIELQISQFSDSYFQNKKLYLRYFALVDQGSYALRRQLALEKEVKRLRGVTMGIDKESQT